MCCEVHDDQWPLASANCSCARMDAGRRVADDGSRLAGEALKPVRLSPPRQA